MKDLTKGNLVEIMLSFSVPFLLASFLQTFYGLADLFITGQFNGAASISAVSIGSQVMHMITVVTVGMSMGCTVMISRGVGSKNRELISKCIGNAVLLFAAIALLGMAVLLLCHRGIISLLSVPEEAIPQTTAYLLVCFAGVPFIVAYNVIAGIFRGLGDTKRPMYFVAVAGVFNIIGDYILIGPLGMGALGAAIATVSSQALSVLFALAALWKFDIGVKLHKSDLAPDSKVIKDMLGIGFPIAVQEGVIQISFLAITAIANSRGVDVAAAVGIVEKMIGFLFLVPSAMLSTVSAVAAQNAAAGKHDRGRKALKLGILICAGFGFIVAVIVQFTAADIVGLFVNDEPEVVRLGAQYFRTYVFDCAAAGIHFCFSGYFSAYGKSVYSFIHNIISVITIRIPGAYLASVLFPATLAPMGMAAPLGSALSALICLWIYRHNMNLWSGNCAKLS